MNVAILDDAVTPAVPAYGEAPCDLSQVYVEHVDAVFSYVRRTCDATMTADIVQDVFTIWWRQQERFDPSRGTVRGLLMTMAHHRMVDAIRAESSLRQREDRRGHDRSSTMLPEEPDVEVLRSERAQRVRAAIAELKPCLRQAVLMAVDGEMSYREIARELEQPEGTIKSRMRLGLELLRRALHDELP